MNPRDLFSGFSALLFDCDGTIANSMPAHLRAWNQALSSYGAKLTERENAQWAGQPGALIVASLNEKHGLKMPADEVVRLKEKNYLELITTVEAVTDVVSAIRTFHGVLPMAVVSGSPRDSVTRTLAHLGLTDFFGAVLGSEDYAHGKPAPDCFLNAASRLGVDPARCLVFEDAELGIQSAIAAGMKWVRVVPSKGFDLARSDFSGN